MIVCHEHEISNMRPKSEIKPGASPFGQWLAERRRARGFTQTQLADEVEVSSAHISKLEAGLATASREMVIRIASSLALDGEDQDMVDRVVRQGLWAAGYVPDDMKNSWNEDAQMIVEAYEGASSVGKTVIKRAAELAMEIERESTIGKKAE